MVFVGEGSGRNDRKGGIVFLVGGKMGRGPWFSWGKEEER